MRIARITLLTGALALVATFAAFQFADPAGAAGTASDTDSATGGPAGQAIEAAAAVVRDTDAGAFGSPVLKDALGDLLATAKALTIDGCKSENDEEANRIFDAAAWTLDIALRHVDGEEGEREGAHLDDWLADAAAKTLICGSVRQAKNEVFRSKRERR